MTIINTTNGGGAKTIAGEEKPSSFPSEYPAPEGYDGWSKLTIDAPDNLSADNIRKDVEIAGVTGTYEPPLTTQEGTITEFPMTYTTPEGFYGMSTVIAHAPETLVADNIKKGVEVANITGTYEPALQVKGTRATSFPVIIEPDSDYYGLEQASVTAPENLSAENIRDGVTIAGVEGTYETPTQKKYLKPEAFPTDVTPDAGYALSMVSVTSPDNLYPMYIKKDVEIAGVTGTYEATPNLTTVTKTPSWVPFDIYTPDGYDGMSKVTVGKDVTLLPENIKQGIRIYNVLGTYDGNLEKSHLVDVTDVAFTPAIIGGYDYFEFYPSTGYDGMKLAWLRNNSDSPLKPENIKKGVTIMGYEGTYEGGGGTVEYDSKGYRTNFSVTQEDLEGVTAIGESAFMYQGILSIDMPDSITTIGTYAFNGCTKLTEVLLPSNLTSLGSGFTNYGIFYKCSKLASITIPESVTSLGAYCFYDCSSLTSITIPESVTSLGESCFYFCSSLTSITIPEGVTSLGNNCFNSCSSLTSITIPEGVTSLGNYCFYFCTSLTSITIPESVTSLGESCFNSCSSLTSITIPEGVTSLGNYCFYRCLSLASVTMLRATPPTLGSDAFNNTASDLVITVPKGSLDAYKTATNWSAWADKMVEASE